MPEQVKQIWARVRDFFKNMNKRLRIALIAVAGAVVVLIVGLTIYNATRPYTALFTGLSSEDLTAVTSYLDSAGVRDFQIRNGDSVYVRESQEDTLRAAIIMQGYPTSGYSYGTYFDNVGTLSSQSDREQAALYDLQDRLGRTIRKIDGVQDAEVYITPGENRRYILSDDTIEATAGVQVTMQAGKAVTSELVTAIQRLVASAQQGLTFSNVEVTDSAGNSYSSSGTAGTLSETMKYKLALEDQVNEQVHNSIMNVLVPYCGVDNVTVSVHSTVDVSHTYTESLIYEQAEDSVLGSRGSMGIIGSQVWDRSLVRDGDTAAGGTVGTPSNAELNEYVTIDDEARGNERELTNYGEIDYDNTHHNVQTDQPPGTVTDVTVAVAVNSAGVNIQDQGRFVHLVATAAGISAEVEADKIAILYYPFYQSGGSGDDASPGGAATTIFGLPAWAVYAAIAGIALFLALLLILLLLRSGKRRRAGAGVSNEPGEGELEGMEPPTQGADIMDVHTEESMQMRKDVRQFVEENPTIAAQMVKNWLRGGEEN